MGGGNMSRSSFPLISFFSLPFPPTFSSPLPSPPPHLPLPTSSAPPPSFFSYVLLCCPLVLFGPVHYDPLAKGLLSVQTSLSSFCLL